MRPPASTTTFQRIQKWAIGLGLALGLVVTATCQTAATNSSSVDYQRARMDPIHFKPAIDSATDKQCLACHAEVLKPSVRSESIAGVKASEAKAWYQDTSTYKGAQDTFHRRHLSTEFATKVMQMRCTTCHEGSSPRDEAPNTSASNQNQALVLRKMVNPETSCLKCHGKFDHEVMSLPGPWPTVKETFQNNCLLCHSGIRTNRHQVNYLNAAEIEKMGAQSGDTCFGCHGGRSWYRISYPYPRHKWEGMPADTPDWAKNRPTESDVRFLNKITEQIKSK
jgi:hypothetical protein